MKLSHYISLAQIINGYYYYHWSRYFPYSTASSIFKLWTDDCSRPEKGIISFAQEIRKGFSWVAGNWNETWRMSQSHPGRSITGRGVNAGKGWGILQRKKNYSTHICSCNRVIGLVRDRGRTRGTKLIYRIKWDTPFNYIPLLLSSILIQPPSLPRGILSHPQESLLTNRKVRMTQFSIISFGCAGTEKRLRIANVRASENT